MHLDIRLLSRSNPHSNTEPTHNLLLRASHAAHFYSFGPQKNGAPKSEIISSEINFHLDRKQERLMY